MQYPELRRALASKGRTEEDQRGHHVFFFIEVDGRAYRATKLSHGAKGQIPGKILGMIARQMRLTNPELRAFVKCPLAFEQWLDL